MKLLIVVALQAVVILGCEQPPPPYVPKPATAPAIVYCNDNTGHIAGATPFVLGGKCCCTPSEALVAELAAGGVNTSVEELNSQYKAAGIVLRGPGHQRCNGLCPAGPHVVLGGKCMAPPTPGTQYYESVITGRGAKRLGAVTTQPAERSSK